MPKFKACADDEDDVTMVTLPNLDGLSSQAEATCMKRCELPRLLFIACCRLPPTMALFTGIQYYPSAFGSTPNLLRQGPLPSIDVCFEREKSYNILLLVFFSRCLQVNAMRMVICHPLRRREKNPNTVKLNDSSQAEH